MVSVRSGFRRCLPSISAPRASIRFVRRYAVRRRSVWTSLGASVGVKARQFSVLPAARTVHCTTHLHPNNANTHRRTSVNDRSQCVPDRPLCMNQHARGIRSFRMPTLAGKVIYNNYIAVDSLYRSLI